MKFSTWLESRQFGRLIPQETLALVPQLKQMARDLTAKYDQDPASVEEYQEFPTTVPDPFVPNRQVHFVFLTIEEWQKRKIRPAQGIMMRTDKHSAIAYRIPMDSYDTVYHEIVHMYDPKLFKGISKIIRGDMTTAHEIDANLGGFVDMAKERLSQSSPEEKAFLLDDLKKWLKKSKTDNDFDPWQMPKLLPMPVWHLWRNPKQKRRFVSILSNELF